MSKDLSEVQVEWSGDKLFIGTGIGHAVVFDSNTSAIPIGIGPMKGPVVSLDVCSGTGLVAILRKRKQKLTSLNVCQR